MRVSLLKGTASALNEDTTPPPWESKSAFPDGKKGRQKAGKYVFPSRGFPRERKVKMDAEWFRKMQYYVFI